MEIFIKIAQFLLSLSFLIILHEFGHFIAARIFKTRVEKFYLFFDAWGKKLFSIKRGDTEYGIGWLPLGGYVKISGMIDESMDKEQMKLPPKPYEFRSKPAWQRLIIMLGGVTVNFILGILIYIMIAFVWGEDYVSTKGVKHGFSVADSFEQYGFQEGDNILKIDGKVPFNVLDVNKDLFLKDIKTLTVKHPDGNIETIKLPEGVGKKMWNEGILFPFQPRSMAVIDTVVSNSPAEKAGVLKGDRIIDVNNSPVTYWNEFTKKVDSTTTSLRVLRGADTIEIAIKPEVLDTKSKKLKIGVSSFGDNAIETQHKKYSFLESISRGNRMGLNKLQSYIGQFKYLFTKKGAGEIGGFIAIGKIFPSTWNWQAFWSITAFLSIMLGFMNLLPIPALDGGHALFVLFEMITGRKPSDKFLEYAQITGFVLLMGLLLLANGNDIFKLIKAWL